MDFLHVRWLGDEANYNSGWKVRRLHRVCFLDSQVSRAFGFIDPAEVIRGIHLIPAFAYGHTKLLLPHSIARSESDEDEDWAAFYVNSFVDRDMFMRLRGGGVGHHSLRSATDRFLSDRHKSDLQASQATSHEDQGLQDESEDECPEEPSVVETDEDKSADENEGDNEEDDSGNSEDGEAEHDTDDNLLVELGDLEYGAL